MTPQNLNLIANAFYILSAICLAIGVYLFFYLHIVEVFNDLTGQSVKKQLRQIRTQPQLQSSKPGLPASNSAPKSKKAKFTPEASVQDREIQLDSGINLGIGSEPTDLLQSDSEPTTLLETEALTTLLNAESAATTVLSPSHPEAENNEKKIRILKQEIVVHTEIDPELKTKEADL